jgi:hypothetical protein
VSAIDALIFGHDQSESDLGWPVERESSRIFSGSPSYRRAAE